MCDAASKVIEEGGNVEDALNAAIRKQVQRVLDGDASIPLLMYSIPASELLAYFDVEPA